jgi:hypothetical protein
LLADKKVDFVLGPNNYRGARLGARRAGRTFHWFLKPEAPSNYEHSLGQLRDDPVGNLY